MTTHVFIVDDNTFKYHLEYMFAGTGAKDYVVNFNNSEGKKSNSDSERLLVSMLADACRIRKGDKIIFYLRQNKFHEGLFFGVFQAKEDGCFLDNNDGNQFLKAELNKSLTFRTKIEPYKVYENGVTEWQALDEIKNLKYAYEMLWSLIYRKLKAERGNTMITTYESAYLEHLISYNNDEFSLKSDGCFSYDSDSQKIIKSNATYSYTGKMEEINILPRLRYKLTHSLPGFEIHLQMFITQNIGKEKIKSLNKILDINSENLEWIGNEVSCGVGMQRIDILLSKIVDKKENKNLVIPIELKATVTNEKFFNQIQRYIDWLVQYYIPNRKFDNIQPVLICKERKRESKTIRSALLEFNKKNKNIGKEKYITIYPLKTIEYSFENESLIFKEKDYTK